MTGKRRLFGAIRKLPSGRFQATYWKDSTQHAMTHRTKADASAWLSTIEADILRGRWIDRRGGHVLFGEYSERWLQRRREDVLRPLAATTQAKYRSLLDTYLIPEFGKQKLSEIKAPQVEAWYGLIAQDHPMTAAGAYRLLSTIYNAAITKDKIFAPSPCQIEGGSREHADERPVATPADLRAALDVTPEKYRVALMLAAWCQLRRSEILGLQRGDIDLSTGSIKIQRAWLLTSDGKTVLGPPKSDAGCRTVFMPPHVKGAMRGHLEAFTDSAEDAWLFGHDGRPLPPRTLERVWARARERSGLRPDLRLHDLRHSGLTWAATTGATIAELMRQAGHASPAAALRYQHAADDRARALAEALGQLVGN